MYYSHVWLFVLFIKNQPEMRRKIVLDSYVINLLIHKIFYFFNHLLFFLKYHWQFWVHVWIFFTQLVQNVIPENRQTNLKRRTE